MPHDPARRAPAGVPLDWVVVTGGAHARGGMEKANAALVRHLISTGATVHLVTHEAAPDLAGSDRVRLHIVPRVFGISATDIPLDFAGRRVARAVCASSPGARVIVNGGNCSWPDVNWVHYVHHAWRPQPRGPFPYRAKERLLNVMYRRAERRALRGARTIIVNSGLTRRDVIEQIGVLPERVRLVYLGAESGWTPPGPDERARARSDFGARPGDRVVAFVGGLGHDERKGFDVVLSAWRVLENDPAFHGRLLVAGAGRRLLPYAAEAARDIGRNPIRFLGHTAAVSTVLAAADLTIGPSRYEPYGLNVQESLVRGVPAIVTRRSGIAERYTGALEPLLLGDPEDVGALVAAIRVWDGDREKFRQAAVVLGDRLRAHTWADMSRDLVHEVLGGGAPARRATASARDSGAPAAAVNRRGAGH
jgi:glycosyltransferase involved in cell wall biosynthesis